MKLLKISDNHFVVLDGNPVRVGDHCICIDPDSVNNGKIIKNETEWVAPNWFRISHSTQPLDGGILYFENTIPLFEVKELIGVEDVEKKAEEAFPIIPGTHPNINWDRSNLQEGFVTGYLQAIEDNKDKKYTEEDVRVAIRLSITPKYDHILEFYTEEEVIQSMQPKTEWEVEFVDGQFKLKS